VAQGSFQLEELSPHQTAFLIHGGAGPQDPKGPEMDTARSAIQQIAQIVAVDGHIGVPRIDDSPETHLAESCALLASTKLEDHPSFNAGIGSAVQGDGLIRVSASFMESTRAKFSGVINVRDLRNPSLLAHHLQTKRFSVLDQTGCEALARDLGLPHENLFTPKRFNRWLELRQREIELGSQQADGKGTIGCVAIDAAANLAAVTSTGGVGNETPGRVGDTPTVAGNYCTKNIAISCTGYGEQIIDDGFAVRLAVRAEDGKNLEDAMHRCLDESMARDHGLAAIALYYQRETHTISWVAGTTEDYFVWAAATPKGLQVFEIA
jgi:L-asparaginase